MLGHRLRAFRLAAGLTQRRLAERAGLSLEAVWAIENDRKAPRRSTLELLAAALGVHPEDLTRAGE